MTDSLEQQTDAHYGRIGVECGSAGECFFQSLARQLSLGGPHSENNYDARALRRLVDEQLTGMLMYQRRDLLGAVGEEVFGNINAYLALEERLRDQEWADDFMISIIVFLFKYQYSYFQRNELGRAVYNWKSSEWLYSRFAILSWFALSIL